MRAYATGNKPAHRTTVSAVLRAASVAQEGKRDESRMAPARPERQQTEHSTAKRRNTEAESNERERLETDLKSLPVTPCSTATTRGLRSSGVTTYIDKPDVNRRHKVRTVTTVVILTVPARGDRDT